MPVKSVYMMTDLEGVAGVDDWDPRHYDYAAEAKGVYERSEVQRLLTGEVNAACKGLFAAGVEEILINDGHGAGRTILVEELIPGVKIARGKERPSWLVGISPRFDALVQVGMHAMGYTEHACLAHTMSRFVKYRVNGREVGEMEIAAYLAGELGIPWTFTCGDGYACREAEEWAPGIVTAAVKEGLSELSAIHLTPVDACTLIEEQIPHSVAAAGEIAPLIADSPVTLEIQREEPWPANTREGAVRVDAFTVRFTGESFWSVFHHASYGKPDLPLPIE